MCRSRHNRVIRTRVVPFHPAESHPVRGKRGRPTVVELLTDCNLEKAIAKRDASELRWRKYGRPLVGTFLLIGAVAWIAWILSGCEDCDYRYTPFECRWRCRSCWTLQGDQDTCTAACISTGGPVCPGGGR